jgi:hypothetical protein
MMMHKSFSPFHFYTRKAQKDPRENDTKELQKNLKCVKKKERKVALESCALISSHFSPPNFHFIGESRKGEGEGYIYTFSSLF